MWRVARQHPEHPPNAEGALGRGGRHAKPRAAFEKQCSCIKYWNEVNRPLPALPGGSPVGAPRIGHARPRHRCLPPRTATRPATLHIVGATSGASDHRAALMAAYISAIKVLIKLLLPSLRRRQGFCGVAAPAARDACGLKAATPRHPTHWPLANGRHRDRLWHHTPVWQSVATRTSTCQQLPVKAKSGGRQPCARPPNIYIYIYIYVSLSATPFYDGIT